MASDTNSSDEVHYRIVDDDGRWSVFADHPSGATHGVVVHVEEGLARHVLDYVLGDQDDSEVLVPAVTVPAGTTERIGALVRRIDADDLIAELGVVYEALRPALTTVDDHGDAMFQEFERATGWEALWDTLTRLAGACIIATDASDGDLVLPDWTPDEVRHKREVADLEALMGVSHDEAELMCSDDVQVREAAWSAHVERVQRETETTGVES